MNRRSLWMAMVLCAAQWNVASRAVAQGQSVVPTSGTAVVTPENEEQFYQRQLNAAKRVILDRKYEEYHLAVSQQEIDEAVSQTLMVVYGKPTFTQADADAKNQEIDALKTLMTKWRSDPQQAEALWRTSYSNIVSAELWEIAKHDYSTDVGYSSLMRTFHVTVEGQYWGSTKVAREDLLRKKLEMALKADQSIAPNEHLEDWLGRQPEIKKILEEHHAMVRMLHPPTPDAATTRPMITRTPKIVGTIRIDQPVRDGATSWTIIGTPFVMH
jgi:hypothetical protein